MELLLNNQPVNEIENTICEIEGIQAARIIADPDDVKEIHVLSNNSKNTKQLCRDIESAILAKHGLQIDYRKISIAQVAVKDEKPEVIRPKIQSVNIETAGLKMRVTVTLQSEGKDYQGISSGTASKAGKVRLIAQAAINAIEKINQSDGNFDLDAISVIALGTKRVVTACVTFLTPNEELVFTGSAIVADSNENDAIVKSVLNALNRRFGYLK